MFNKKLIIFLLLIIFVFSFLSFAYAEGGKLTEHLKSGVDSNNVIDKVDEGGYKAVFSLRRLVIVGAAVFLVWAGIIFWGAGGNDTKISSAKQKLLFFFIALFLVFGAESILVSVFDFFGIDITKYVGGS